MNSTTTKFDLHSHTRFSDGDLTPAELIELAQEKGISHLGLTDHDTLSGLHDARSAARGTLVCLINGIEFSCTWNGQLLHILGLSIDPEAGELQYGVEFNRQQRHTRANQMHKRFEALGIRLREQVENMIGEHGVPTRPHFAQALIDVGLVKDKTQAFKRYLARGKPGYVPMEWPSLAQIAQWIHSADGIAVLAHPMRYKFSRSKLVRLIKDMQEVDMRGIEVSTATTNSSQVSMLGALANQHKLLASVGSDFHSFDQPWATLGSAEPLPESLTPVWREFN